MTARVPRVIPTLLLAADGFVKTRGFASPRYVGDPVNVINLFNLFEVDEIVVLDIDATPNGRLPDFALLEELAGECWVPLTYGGGLRTVEHARQALTIGCEKVVFGTVAHEDPAVIAATAATFGTQAVVVAVDARLTQRGHEVFVRGGRLSTGVHAPEYARTAVAHGAGELLLTSIDREGSMAGFDLELVRSVTTAVAVPVIASGGAGSRADLTRPIREAGASAVAAGSLFVFSGRGGGVLVNFPDRPELEALFR